LAAFGIAADMGAGGVELDVQMTRDGALVVIHDETVDRVSNGSGAVRDFTLAELKRLNFNKKGITKPLFMGIPTLGETLALLDAAGLDVNIELKNGLTYYEGLEEKVLDEVRRVGFGQRVIYSSFNHISVRRVRQIDPGAETALLFGGGIIVCPEAVAACGAAAAHADMRTLAYPGFAQAYRESGVALRVWGANTEEHFALCRSAGAVALITDYPDRAVGFFR
jgi:glycerophosphoryl diester phosphodiesterase